MKKRPIIIQFDNEEHDVDSVDLILFNWGLELSGSAYDKKTARKLLSKIKSKKIVPDIAILDAFIDNDEKDGQKVAKIIRDLNKDVKIIGYSTYDTDEWADYSIGKGEFKNDNKLTDILSEILGEEYVYDNATLEVNQEEAETKYDKSKFKREFTE